MDEVPFDYAGPPELGEAVVGALKRVVDPEVAVNIVDLGLVYGVEVTDDLAYVRMTMTSAACPVTDMLMEEVKAELGDVVGSGRNVEVELVWDPPWTPDRLSLSARRFMGW